MILNWESYQMWMHFFVGLVILVSIIVGVLAITLPRDALIQVIVFRDFFDTTLPILGFGALVKYLCTTENHKHK